MMLLNIDANPKTVKGQKYGYMTAVLYLAPYLASGHNVCPMAARADCWRTCLNVQGRGGIASGTMRRGGLTLPDNAIQRARIRKTRALLADRAAFIEGLCDEIEAFERKAARAGLVPCVRLNGTSDLLWETFGDRDGFTIFARFPRLQFYDYTKLPTRLHRAMPSNYHLSLSWSGANAKYQYAVETIARETGAPLVVVAHPDRTGLTALFDRSGCTHVVDGDAHDLRFLEKPHALVLLKAKGTAKRDVGGFVFGRAIP